MRQDKIYRKVVEYLKQAIASGEMKLGDAIYSENQLCSLLQVSRTSVRRAIREMVEANILESRQGVGTFVKGLNPSRAICLVNHHARTLRYSPADSYYMDFIYAAEKEAGKENFRFLIFSGVVRNETEIRSKMAHLNADGIILDGNFQDHFDDLEAFRRQYPNIVVLDGNPQETRLPSVSPDLTPGFIEILKLAAERGGETLFLYGGKPARRRWALHCFREALKSSGSAKADFLDYTENVFDDLLDGIDHQYLIMDALDKAMSGGKRYGSIVCAADRTAMSAIDVLKHRGYSVPGDIAVSGAGGIAFSAMTSPAITTLKMPCPCMAAEAVRLLARQLRGEDAKGTTLLPSPLLRRQSM